MGRRITSLTLQKRNRQRVNVYLDGEFAFGLARIVAAWLQVGQELSEEKISNLMAEDERESAYQRALNWISYRPRTELEIRRSLRRQSVSDEVIAYVIERLKSSRLIDDPGFARNWVENRSELRPRGRRALAYELRQHGVEPEIIENSIGEIDEEKLAYQAAVRQARKIRTTDWKEFRQKMLRHLAARGFSYETSADAARRVWDETSQAEPIRDERA